MQQNKKNSSDQKIASNRFESIGISANEWKFCKKKCKENFIGKNIQPSFLAAKLNLIYGGVSSNELFLNA